MVDGFVGSLHIACVDSENCCQFSEGSYVPARISANIFGLTIFFPLTGEEIEDMIDSVVVQVAQFRSGDHFDDSYVGGSEQVSSIPSSVEALCWEKTTG